MTHTQVTVSEEALRELVREALDGGHLGDLTMPEEEPPVNVNDVVDQSAAVTDPINPNFVPQTKPELDVALKQLTKDVPIDNVPKLYKAVLDVIETEDLENEEDEQMKKAAEGGTTQVEEMVRKAVRSVLDEAPLPPVRKIPFGVHGTEYMNSFQHAKDSLKDRFGKEEEPEVDAEEPEDAKPKKRGAYKATAIGNMEDVSGASFQDIAKELGFSVAGAKQAVDKALEKARFLATGIDSDDLEIMILQTMNEYIASLTKTGELSAADVQLMKDHPDIVRELDGFREFLATAIKRKRKDGQEVESPLGEHLKKVAEAMNYVGIKAKVVHKKKDLSEARHGKKVPFTATNLQLPGAGYLHLNNKDPEWSVLETEDGVEVARQAKRSSGRVFQQGTNPDYEGRESYQLQYKKGPDADWSNYDSQARKGQLLNSEFLQRLGTYFSKTTSEAADTKGRTVCGKVIMTKRGIRHMCALKPGHTGGCRVNSKN